MAIALAQTPFVLMYRRMSGPYLFLFVDKLSTVEMNGGWRSLFSEYSKVGKRTRRRWHHCRAVVPPSITRIVPLQYDASSEPRYRQP